MEREPDAPEPADVEAAAEPDVDLDEVERDLADVERTLRDLDDAGDWTGDAPDGPPAVR